MSPQENDKTPELLSSTAQIRFLELQRFFAQGRLLLVGAELDLVQVANHIVSDHASEIASLIEAGDLIIPSDDLARRWVEQDQLLWCVVVAPYLLTQEVFVDDK